MGKLRLMKQGGGVTGEAAKQAAWGIFFTAGYAAILLWFGAIDVYHRRFSDAGLPVLIENVCRVVFIFYLFWIVHEVGAWLLRLVAGDAVEQEDPLDRLALRFFAGTGVWHVLLLGLGYGTFYTRPVAVALTLPVVAIASPRILRLARELRSSRLGDGTVRPGSIVKAGGWAGVLTLGLFLVVLMIKGLYPGGGHDYFTHYFYYDLAVTERGNLGPNEVWTHYYYSKGAGLFFLAMLLTDPLAPQLVSFCFFLAELIAFALLLRRVAPSSAWRWSAIVLLLGLYIYTPGPGTTRGYGGWGDFEKLHELNAALIMAVLWMTIGLTERRGRALLGWGAAAASAVVAAVIINNTVAVYLGAVFAVLAGLWLFRRHYLHVVTCLALGATAGVTLVVILVINQLTTGLILDQAMVLFWPFTDVEKLYRWGALPTVIDQYWGMVHRAAGSGFSFGTVALLAKSLRLEMFGPLLLAGFVFATWAWRRRRLAAVDLTAASVLTLAAGMMLVLALSVGRAQSVSFYRYTSFMLPIILLLGVTLCRIGQHATDDLTSSYAKWLRDPRLPAVLVLACFITAFISYHPRRAPLDAVADSARFTAGLYSIDKAYASQDGRPARRSWGAIYPGARGAYAVVGPNTRIWSLHTESYCMLPDCWVESWPGFILTRDWDRVMFGTPEEGREALKAAGQNYFLFSTELYIYDPLPRSPLFSPDNIGRYFGLRWTEGTTSLLTWSGPDTKPLDAAWLARYRSAVESGPSVQNYPYAEVKEVFARLRATPHPWRPIPLPW